VIPPWERVLYGCFGGAVAAFFEVFELRRVPAKRRPAWLKSKLYWGLNFCRVVLGGIVVLLYIRNGDVLQVFECVYLGFSGPLVLKGLFSGTPPVPPGKTDLMIKADRRTNSATAGSQ
jgi:hypothetical protein